MTTRAAKAATECPVVSHETYLDAGRTGSAGASCVVDGKTWVNVTFECQESFSVEASALADAYDCTC